MSLLTATRGYEIIHTIKDLTDDDELDLSHLVRGPMRRNGTQRAFFTDYQELYPVAEFRTFRRPDGGRGAGKLRYVFGDDCPLEVLEVVVYRPWEENILHYADAEEPTVLPHANTLDYLPDTEFELGVWRGHIKSVMIDRRSFDQLKKLAGVHVADCELEQLNDFIGRTVKFGRRLGNNAAIIRHNQKFGTGAAVHSEWLTMLRNWLSHAMQLQRPNGSWDELVMTGLAEEASVILRSTWQSFRPFTRKIEP